RRFRAARACHASGARSLWAMRFSLARSSRNVLYQCGGGDRRRAREVHDLADVAEVVELPLPVVSHRQNGRAVMGHVVPFELQALLDEHLVDHPEAADDLQALILGENRGTALLAEVELVRGHPHDQPVAEGTGPVEHPDVPHVQHVERAEGDDRALAQVGSSKGLASWGRVARPSAARIPRRLPRHLYFPGRGARQPAIAARAERAASATVKEASPLPSLTRPGRTTATAISRAFSADSSPPAGRALTSLATTRVPTARASLTITESPSQSVGRRKTSDRASAAQTSAPVRLNDSWTHSRSDTDSRSRARSGPSWS